MKVHQILLAEDETRPEKTTRTASKKRIYQICPHKKKINEFLKIRFKLCNSETLANF